MTIPNVNPSASAKNFSPPIIPSLTESGNWFRLAKAIQKMFPHVLTNEEISYARDCSGVDELSEEAKRTIEKIKELRAVFISSDDDVCRIETGLGLLRQTLPPSSGIRSIPDPEKDARAFLFSKIDRTMHTFISEGVRAFETKTNTICAFDLAYTLVKAVGITESTFEEVMVKFGSLDQCIRAIKSPLFTTIFFKEEGDFDQRLLVYSILNSAKLCGYELSEDIAYLPFQALYFLARVVKELTILGKTDVIKPLLEMSVIPESAIGSVESNFALFSHVGRLYQTEAEEVLFNSDPRNASEVLTRFFQAIKLLDIATDSHQKSAAFPSWMQLVGLEKKEGIYFLVSRSQKLFGLLETFAARIRERYKESHLASVMPLLLSNEFTTALEYEDVPTRFSEALLGFLFLEVEKCYELVLALVEKIKTTKDDKHYLRLITLAPFFEVEKLSLLIDFVERTPNVTLPDLVINPAFEITSGSQFFKTASSYALFVEVLPTDNELHFLSHTGRVFSGYWDFESAEKGLEELEILFQGFLPILPFLYDLYVSEEVQKVFPEGGWFSSVVRTERSQRHGKAKALQKALSLTDNTIIRALLILLSRYFPEEVYGVIAEQLIDSSAEIHREETDKVSFAISILKKSKSIIPLESHGTLESLTMCSEIERVEEDFLFVKLYAEFFFPSGESPLFDKIVALADWSNHPRHIRNPYRVYKWIELERNEPISKIVKPRFSHNEKSYTLELEHLVEETTIVGSNFPKKYGANLLERVLTSFWKRIDTLSPEKKEERLRALARLTKVNKEYLYSLYSTNTATIAIFNTEIGPDEAMPRKVALSRIILEYIAELSDAIDAGDPARFSPQEEAVFLLYSLIGLQTCDTGVEAALEVFFEQILSEEKQKQLQGLRSDEEKLSAVIRMFSKRIIDKVFSSSNPFMRRFIGGTDLLQLVHLRRYLLNRLGVALGFGEAQEFDFAVGVLDDSLLQVKKEILLCDFFSYMTPERYILEMERMLNEYFSTDYMTIANFFAESASKRIKLDEEGVSWSLTREAVIDILVRFSILQPVVQPGSSSNRKRERE